MEIRSGHDALESAPIDFLHPDLLSSVQPLLCRFPAVPSNVARLLVIDLSGLVICLEQLPIIALQSGFLQQLPFRYIQSRLAIFSASPRQAVVQRLSWLLLLEDVHLAVLCYRYHERGGISPEHLKRRRTPVKELLLPLIHIVEDSCKDFLCVDRYFHILKN